MILQLQPTLFVETPLGIGQALFVIDYGKHQNMCWVVALVRDGSIKHFDSNDVILSNSYSSGLHLANHRGNGSSGVF